jgi:hypothetical protein
VKWTVVMRTLFSGRTRKRRGNESFLIRIGRRVQSLFRDRSGWVVILGENR